MKNIESSIIDRSIIKEFCKYAKEFPEYDNIPCEIRLVDNIYDYVYNDDEIYAQQVLCKEELLLGLFYVDAEKKQIILLKKTDGVDVLGTLLHEIVHLFDYIRLADYHGNYNYRELQDDIFFILWSEFHANYLSYSYLIHCGKSTCSPMEIAQQIKNTLQEYYSSSIYLDLQTTVNKTVRSYGQYAALYVNYPTELTKYLAGFYINRKFLKVYDFLLDHTTFDEFIRDYDQWVSTLNDIT